MDIYFVEQGSAEWEEARELRFTLFFQAHGLDRAIMDDQYEPLADHLVAVDTGNVAGYGRLHTSGDKHFFITQMVVSPSRQGCGIGNLILERLVGRAKRLEARSIELEARVSAIDFYIKSGFHRRGKVYLSKNTRVPHVHMEYPGV